MEVKFACESVDIAETEEEEGGGHAAEEEILQSGFGGTEALFVERGHGVKAEAEEFQRDENHQEIFCADEEHHGDGGEEQEREEFAGVSREIGVDRKPGDEDGQEEKDYFQDDGQLGEARSCFKGYVAADEDVRGPSEPEGRCDAADGCQNCGEVLAAARGTLA